MRKGPDGIYYDFHMVFDMVLPNILAAKLEIYGFTGDGCTIGWEKDYLNACM